MRPLNANYSHSRLFISPQLAMDTNVIYLSHLIILLIISTQVACKYYADNGLEQTIAYNFLSGRQRSQITQDILDVLDIHRPKSRVHENDSSAPKFLRQVYQSLWDEETGDLKLNASDHLTIEGQQLSRKFVRSLYQSDKIISFPNQIVTSHRHHGKDNRYKFDLSRVSPADTLLYAQLWMYRDELLNVAPVNLTYTVTVYSVHRDSGEKKRLTQVSSKLLTAGHWGWIPLNVTAALDEWTHQGHLGSHVLALRVSTAVVEVEANEIGLTGHRGRKDRQAFLMCFFQSPDNTATLTRHRRATDGHRRGDVSFYDDDESWNPYRSRSDLSKFLSSSGRSCQKKTLYVSFRDLGWQDWIIAPDGYGAFFCHGECDFPLSPHMNATNHAIVRTLYSLIHNEIPKPCCAPTKLSPIQVLYYDDNSNVVLKKYKNMVVSSCGCH